MRSNGYGLFITLEGIDGCGKTTQAKMLADALEETGLRVKLVREPGGTSLGERVRSILKDPEAEISDLSELLLFAAARAQVVNEVIRDELENGSVVICDRFTHSTLAYQGGGRGLPLDNIRAVNQVATGGLEPDAVFFFRLSPELAKARAASRGGVAADRFDKSGDDFFRRVADTYEQVLPKSERNFHFDASADIETISREVAVIASELTTGRELRMLTSRRL
jgi:dTMP kinase